MPAGIVLVCLPQQESKPAPAPTAPQVQKADLEQQLEEILSKIAGAGKVEVLLSQAAGEQTLYQQDQDGSGQQTSTVVLHGEARQEVGLVRQVNPPREEILSKIAGAGKVEVLLSQAAGEQTLYQQDQDGSGQQTSTVVLHGEARQEVGLVRQVNPPRYQGAIVACQGANNPQLRLELVEAVCRATGLGADRVSILKLK